MSYSHCLAITISLVLFLPPSMAFAQDNVTSAINEAKVETQKLLIKLKASLPEEAEQPNNDEGVQEENSKEGQTSALDAVEAESVIKEVQALDQHLEKIETLNEVEKAKKLLAAGITIGAAIAFEYYLATDTTNSTGDIAAMPFVGFIPWYWGNGKPSQEAFCASSYLGAQVDGAQTAADALARKQASVLLEALIVAGKTNEEQTWDDVFSFYDVVISGQRPETTRKMLENAIDIMIDKGEGTQEYKDARRHALNMLSKKEFNWSIGTTARCWWSWIGFWVGHPLGTREISAIHVDTRLTNDNLNNPLEYQPLIAFGLLFTPNYNFAFLPGLVLAREETTGDLNYGIIFSLGLQADLISLFN